MIYCLFLFWWLIAVVFPEASYAASQGQSPFALSCLSWLAWVLLCCPLTVQGPVLPHSIPAWHSGSVSCCCDPMLGAFWSCRFSALFIEPCCAKIPPEFHWKGQTSPWTVHIGMLSERTKTKVTWLSFPCLFFEQWPSGGLKLSLKSQEKRSS